MTSYFALTTLAILGLFIAAQFASFVPVAVNVYQFEFPQTTYTTTVGGTLASGTQASGYAQMQNATGLPT
ncbi:hypothetical protein INO64_13850, partial [Staphylococcus aureus]|nr:hypothetical protein [Staphylococcus aureus]